MAEKRKFSRINFTGKCSVNEEISGELKKWPSKLLDISLKGALIVRPDAWKHPENSSVLLELALEGSDIILECQGMVCHQEDKHRLAIAS